MTERQLRELLERVQGGELTLDAAVERLRRLPFEDLGFAAVDHHRALRNRMGEVIYGEGKTPDQVVAIAARIVADEGAVLVTRCEAALGARLAAEIPGVVHHPRARLAMRRAEEPGGVPGRVAVVSAGTADLPVAEEAALSVEFLGHAVERCWDVGVAGLHRLLACGERLRAADAVIVVAGFEGALPSVVGGLVDRPVIGVPTSVGYGASARGTTALMGMLASCAAGVTVVGIDNGFGAAAAAGRILGARRDG
jgi:NCAIR mutase (PurE)-related protein